MFARYKKAFIFYGVVALMLALALPVSAHIVAEENNIEASIHIDPGDSPIVGLPATIHFNILKGEENFDIATCECMVTISAHDKVLFGEDLHKLDFTYIFPEKNMYTLMMHGKTKDKQSFMLSYDIRVDREDATVSINQVKGDVTHFFLHHGFHTIIVLGAIVVGSVMTVRDLQKNK
jgi:hypothetical protein